MFARILIASLSLSLATVLAAEPIPASNQKLVQALSANATTLSFHDGRLQGPGSQVLAQAAADSQFLMVGEDHGMQESPEFVSALYDIAHPEGYSHLAVEIGPLSAAYLESMERAPDAQQQVDAFLHRYTDFTLPFFNWREESQMLEHVVKADPDKRDVVWGLDQEFVLAPTYLFERLAELAKTAEARTLASAYAVTAAAGDKKLFADKNPAAVWMATSSDAEMQRLVDGYKAEPGSEAEAILQEIAVSREIYQKIFAGRNYESNEQRDELMKHHFMAEYRAAQARGEAVPKVVFKLGANHVFRGISLNDTYEIGDFIPEFAASEGRRSFNIFLIARGGTANAFRPFGSTEADKNAPYDPFGTQAEASFTDLAVFFAAADPAQWTLLDLRPVRRLAHDGKLGKIDPRLMRALMTFDAFVVVPESHASTLFY